MCENAIELYETHQKAYGLTCVSRASVLRWLKGQRTKSTGKIMTGLILTAKASAKVFGFPLGRGDKQIILFGAFEGGVQKVILS